MSWLQWPHTPVVAAEPATVAAVLAAGDQGEEGEDAATIVQVVVAAAVEKRGVVARRPPALEKRAGPRRVAHEELARVERVVVVAGEEEVGVRLGSEADGGLNRLAAAREQRVRIGPEDQPVATFEQRHDKADFVPLRRARASIYSVVGSRAQNVIVAVPSAISKVVPEGERRVVVGVAARFLSLPPTMTDAGRRKLVL